MPYRLLSSLVLTSLLFVGTASAAIPKNENVLAEKKSPSGKHTMTVTGEELWDGSSNSVFSRNDKLYLDGNRVHFSGAFYPSFGGFSEIDESLWFVSVLPPSAPGGSWHGKTYLHVGEKTLPLCGPGFGGPMFGTGGLIIYDQTSECPRNKRGLYVNGKQVAKIRSRKTTHSHMSRTFSGSYYEFYYSEPFSLWTGKMYRSIPKDMVVRIKPEDLGKNANYTLIPFEKWEFVQDWINK